MTPQQIDGITKARLVCNAKRVQDQLKPFVDNAAYEAWVCANAGINELPESAADSYAEQYAGQSIEELELAVANAADGAPVTETPQSADAPYDVVMDASGAEVGPYDGVTPLEAGQWTRLSNAPSEMLPLTFLDKLGAANYQAITAVAAKNPALDFIVARGLAARSIVIAESFPSLIMMEKAGIIPAGTAIGIWS